VTSRTLGGGSHSVIAPFIVIGKLTDKGDPNFGYDPQSGEYKDTVTAGIIDPTKVVRVALQDDASIAGLLIPTAKPRGQPGMPPDGGMGGMGDMDYYAG